MQQEILEIIADLKAENKSLKAKSDSLEQVAKQANHDFAQLSELLRGQPEFVQGASLVDAFAGYVQRTQAELASAQAPAAAPPEQKAA